jgi:hypothetical protein
MIKKVHVSESDVNHILSFVNVPPTTVLCPQPVPAEIRGIP